MKTSELSDDDLNYMVALAADLKPIPNEPRGFFYWEDACGFPCSGRFVPSIRWDHGGPIIEREGITVIQEGSQFIAMIGVRLSNQNVLVCDFEASGPTYLIAAMRCYVESELGEDVPELP